VPGCRFEGLSGGVEGREVEHRVGVNGVGSGSAVARARGGDSAFIGNRRLQG
jgi:ABC-type cobalamin transport system ATPase subunit